MKGKYIYIILLFTTLSSLLFAQNKDTVRNPDLYKMNIEDLMNLKVETASRYEQKLNEAPASMSVITSEDIKRYGYQTLAEAINSLAGFYFTYDRNYYYGGVRGFSIPGDQNERFLILIDGHEMNEDIYGTAGLGDNLGIDMNTVERIEVVRGPGSALYGTDAMFAVINVITKVPAQKEEIMTSSRLASYNTYVQSAYYGRKINNDLKVSFSGQYGYSKGQDLFFKEYKDSTNKGVAQNLDGAEYYNGYLKLDYKNFSLNGLYSSSQKGIPTASYQAVFDKPSEQSIDISRFIELKYISPNSAAHTPKSASDTGNTLKYMVRAYLNDYTYEGTFPYESFNQYERDDAIWGGIEGQLQWNSFKNNKLIAGADLQQHFEAKVNQWNFNTTYFEDNFPFNIFSVYLQDEYKLLDNLSFIAGGRDAKYSTTGNLFMPRLAIIYNPVKTGTLKLLYGTAFRAPNIFERDYFTVGEQIINTALQPEEIKTYELVYEQKIIPELLANVSLYYNDIKGLITPVTLNTKMYNPLTNDTIYQINQNQNAIDAVAKGIELGLNAKSRTGFGGYINYSYQNLSVSSSVTTATVTNSPQQLLKAGIICPLFNCFYLAIEDDYEAARETLYNTVTSPFNVTNINLSTRTLHNLSISFKVYNVFNRQYELPSKGPLVDYMPAIPQNGRNFIFTINYKF